MGIYGTEHAEITPFAHKTVEVIEFGERHYRQRNEIFAALSLLDDYRRGDKNAIVEMQNRGYAIDPGLLKVDSPDFRQLRELQREPEHMLAESTQVLQSFEKDREDNLATQRELNSKVVEVLNDVSLARLRFHSWARAHQSLANGVKQPGEWVELAVKAGSLLSIPFK